MMVFWLLICLIRLPSFSERNLVQYHKKGDWFEHKFIFENTSRVLAFPFKFGEPNNITVFDKLIEYLYVHEPTEDPAKSTVFAKFEEVGGDVRFTVESVFSRTGMITTYTHADVLDNIMARRRYKRVMPNAVLGHYENVPEKQSANFAQFASILPLLTGATHSTNNKLYLGQAGMSYSLEDILDPESLSILYPFTIGAKQKITVGGVEVEYTFHVTQPDNYTRIWGEFSRSNGTDFFEMEAACHGTHIDMNYTGRNINAHRHYRRALPIIFYGTFEASRDNDDNYTEFISSYQDRSKGAPVGGASRVRLYKRNATYVHEAIDIFGITDNLDVQFVMGKPSVHELSGKVYHVVYTYDGGEKPILHIVFTEQSAGGGSFQIDYAFDGRGIDATYRRETSTGTLTAKRFFRRILPDLVFGRYESVTDSPNFRGFAHSIHFPEITSKTVTEYLRKNDTYMQTFQYGTPSPFQEVPFILGETREQWVKDKWLMEMSYQAFESERVFLRSTFVEKPLSDGAPRWADFVRIADFTKDGYTATYLCGNVTATRKYRRLPPLESLIRE